MKIHEFSDKGKQSNKTERDRQMTSQSLCEKNAELKEENKELLEKVNNFAYILMLSQRWIQIAATVTNATVKMPKE